MRSCSFIMFSIHFIILIILNILKFKYSLKTHKTLKVIISTSLGVCFSTCVCCLDLMKVLSLCDLHNILGREPFVDYFVWDDYIPGCGSVSVEVLHFLSHCPRGLMVHLCTSFVLGVPYYMDNINLRPYECCKTGFLCCIGFLFCFVFLTTKKLRWYQKAHDISRSLWA